MNATKVFLALVFSNFVLSATPSVSQAADPSEVNVKLYEFWVSPNADCSAAVRVIHEANPSYQNVINGPTLGQGIVSDGVYPCVAMRMSDVITFKSATATAFCTPGTLVTRDLFTEGGLNSVGPDGSTISPAGTLANPVETTMWTYFSVSGANGDSPITPSRAFPLGNAFIVNGDRVGTVVVNFTGKIVDESGICSVQPADLSFR